MVVPRHCVLAPAILAVLVAACSDHERDSSVPNVPRAAVAAVAAEVGAIEADWESHPNRLVILVPDGFSVDGWISRRAYLPSGEVALPRKNPEHAFEATLQLDMHWSQDVQSYEQFEFTRSVNGREAIAEVYVAKEQRGGWSSSLE